VIACTTYDDRSKELDMGDKSPKKNDAKKPSKSLKEKRAEKHEKKAGGPSGFKS
jgi:hypothetical protein